MNDNVQNNPNKLVKGVNDTIRADLKQVVTIGSDLNASHIKFAKVGIIIFLYSMLIGALKDFTHSLSLTTPHLLLQKHGYFLSDVHGSRS